MKWYRGAADQGHAVAQFGLGMAYESGQGVAQDYKEAAKWYRQAAEQGQADSQFRLGVMYANGKGAPENAQEAFKWYRRAAANGNALAQNNLGVMYAKGQGVPQDFVFAHMWFNLAAAALSGDEGKSARNSREKVASSMSATQIEKAQEMARRCQRSNFKQCD